MVEELEEELDMHLSIDSGDISKTAKVRTNISSMTRWKEFVGEKYVNARLIFARNNGYPVYQADEFAPSSQMLSRMRWAALDFNG